MQKRNNIQVCVRLKGGLGNQMFQVACGLEVAARNNCLLRLDLSCLENDPLREYSLGIFKIDFKKYRKKRPSSLLRLFFPGFKNNTVLKEGSFSYNYLKLPSANQVLLDGYWQSEKYFQRISEKIVATFRFPEDQLSKVSKQYALEIKRTNTLAVHVRRGDYIANPKVNATHGTCSLSYYRDAIKKIRENDTIIYFFSDDILWCKENFNYEKSVFVQNDGRPDWEDMCLMSMCKNNIIANSSYSWWAAWLNQNSSKKVIAPRKWFRDSTIDTSDLIPDSWIQI